MPPPVRLSPLHHKHLALGATMAPWNDWLRPERYGTVESEVSSAMANVGIVDESCCAKVDVKGGDIDAFASRALRLTDAPQQPGRLWASPPGAAWDGVPIKLFCRLARDHALFVLEGSPSLSTTSPLAVEGPSSAGMRVYLTNVTSVLACLTLIGPKSSQVLGRLTTLDLPSEGYCAEGPVAGVRALVLRPGYGKVPSIHVYSGRDYAEYLWDALLDEGKESGIRPIGNAALDSIRGQTASGGTRPS